MTVPFGKLQQMMMAPGGGSAAPAESSEGGQNDSAADEADTAAGETYSDPAWEAFWEWQYKNRAALAAMPAAERFQSTVDKLNELGLPVAIPWAKAGP